MSTFARSPVRVTAYCILLFAVLLAMPVLASAALPAAVEPVVGGGQITVVNQVFPQTFAVRVIDATGAPVAGVSVYFEVDHSASIGGGSGGPAPSAYPFFEGPVDFVVVQSDANGQAVTPALTAGDSAGYFQIFATVWGGGGIVGHAYFPLQQVESLAAVAIHQGFTGAWYDPGQSGHGLLLEVLPANRLLAYWFAFTPDGTQQAWFGGVGPILGNQAIIYADRGRGGRWIPSFDSTLFALDPWGTLTLTFTDCNHGRVDFYGAGNSSPWGSGSMDLTRLTMPAGLSCP
jgi:hypothetical protein